MNFTNIIADNTLLFKSKFKKQIRDQCRKKKKKKGADETQIVSPKNGKLRTQ
jgi:hypothetical protein